jgi:hypothetical protein
MGHDPSKSVLNQYCQSHDIPNLFVMDGGLLCFLAMPESNADDVGGRLPLLRAYLVDGSAQEGRDLTCRNPQLRGWLRGLDLNQRPLGYERTHELLTR